jgi:cytidylate kinase
VSDELRSLIRVAIDETADRGNVVIVAHAASHALADRDDVLRVLVTASPEVRCARIAAEQGLSEKDAAREIAASDANRSDYLRRFFGEKDELPTHYDIVVNTDRLSTSAAAAVVTAAASQPAPATA